METSYSELREKDVVNVSDGRSLGRVCDIVFTYPDGIVCGIVVPGRRGFRLFKFRCNDMYIDFCHIKKIGGDVILVDLRLSERPHHPKDRDCHKQPPPPPRPREYEGGKIDMGDYE